MPPDRYTASIRVAGIGPGESSRYAPDPVRGLALLDGRPTLLGGEVTVQATGKTIGTLLYRLEGDLLSPVVEHCGGELLLDLESDAAGHAAVTASGLIFSEPAALDDPPLRPTRVVVNLLSGRAYTLRTGPG